MGGARGSCGAELVAKNEHAETAAAGGGVAVAARVTRQPLRLQRPAPITRGVGALLGQFPARGGAPSLLPGQAREVHQAHTHILVIHDVEHKPRGGVQHFIAVRFIPPQAINHIVVNKAAVRPPVSFHVLAKLYHHLLSARV